MNVKDLERMHGRRGGGWAEGNRPRLDPNPSRCDRCGEPMHCRQPGRHWSCADPCPGCHRPVIDGRNCDRTKDCPS